MSARTNNTPHVKQWRVGRVRVTRIVEIFPFQVPADNLFQQGSPELVQRHPWLQPHHATPDGQIIFAFQAFVVQTDTRRIMVDTCLGNDKQREYEVFTKLTNTFLHDLEVAGAPAESIDTVLCTHLHQDHTGWNTRLVDGNWVPTFPNARYLFGREEWQHWIPRLAETSIQVQHLADSIRPVIDAGLVDFVESTHRISDEVWLEPTPGHTPGHVSVCIASEGHQAVITGDVMHHPIQCAEPDLLTHFCGDHERARLTRREFLARHARQETLIIGSHFAEPTVGWLVENGNGQFRLSSEQPGVQVK